MIDIKIFRENPEIIRESEKKRFNDVLRVDKVIKLDEQWRKLLQQVNDLRKERNTISREIGPLKKKGEDITSHTKRVTKIKSDIARIEKKSNKIHEERDSLRYVIGNILLPGVPIAENEEGDETIRTWGKKRSYKFPIKSHMDLVESLDVTELGKASEVSGSRTYYLKNQLVFLNLALIHYALQVLTDKGYTPFWTPPFLRRNVMEGASELSDFEEQLYHDSNEDVFFIATSEQTLAALHMNELIDVDTLPRKYCGLSQCYRREAGSHGKDTKGIFRVHHFEKVEQFMFSHPESSEEMMEELIQNA
ncbi:MAG: aminoacyl--tRNA ligase-related protein, partial [Candidatus Hodarchaeales archaeon]